MITENGDFLKDEFIEDNLLYTSNYETGLVGYYKLNGDLRDYSTTQNHGTNYGLTPTADRFGVSNGAFKGDGVSAYGQIPYISAQLFGLNDFTISFWYKSPSTTSTSSNVIVAKPANGLAETWGFYKNSTNKKQVLFALISAPYTPYIFNTSDLTDGWHLITVKRTGTTIRGFIDGSYASLEILNNTTDLKYNGVIRLSYNSTSGNYGDTAISELRLYNRALSDAEILALYNSTKLAFKEESTIVRAKEFIEDNTISQELIIKLANTTVKNEIIET